VTTFSSYIAHKLYSTAIGNTYAFLRRRGRLKERLFHLLRPLGAEGYVVIKNFVSPCECNQSIAEIEGAFNKFPGYLHLSGDVRLFGSESVVPLARKLFMDYDLLDIAEYITGSRVYCAFTLANMLKTDTLGSSGGGWHRDSTLTQFKAMLYLTDVSSETGAFEIIPRSHLITNILSSEWHGLQSSKQHRYRDDEIESYLRHFNTSSVTIGGEPGTLILFNSSTIHRGRPIRQGQRVALTNYYFPISRSIASIREQFSPVLSDV
jgi:ectoine hydroxylase-related dioxygenase (phytanoyl-CoA dioxygenase family)